MQNLRKELNAEALIKTIKSKFSKIKDPLVFSKISLTDCLMSCLAVFNLKFTSLLQYDLQRNNNTMLHNLRTLFFINNPPSDTYMRERLDVLDHSLIRPAYKTIFSLLQRGKALENFQYLDGHYLLSIDGTGHFSSDTVHCKNCCVKNHKDGRQSYYHQMLAAVVLHPNEKVVIPICPEPILKEDGDNKNDCERNAAKRLLEDVKREHPHLKLIVIEDGLASNAPHIKLLESLSMKYILGVKEGDHDYLFDWIKYAEATEFEYIDEEKFHHKFRFINQVPLNDANHDLKVNFLEYWETDKKGKIKHFSWVTNIHITINNVSKLMRGGRSRWKIENETFNTLKNQGYNFEHNFGHGQKNLCSIMGLIMMLAFLVDQAQLLCCRLYQTAKQSSGTFAALWEKMRTLFDFFEIKTWEQFFSSIAKKKWVNST
jgi:hypothetical protein